MRALDGLAEAVAARDAARMLTDPALGVMPLADYACMMSYLRRDQL